MIIVAIVVASTATIAWAVEMTEGKVVLNVYTDKEVYSPREPVTIVIELKNFGLTTVKLTYGTGLVIFFSICDSDGLLVFTSPRIVPQVITEVELGPGESRHSGCIWDQVDDSGEYVELPDAFVVHATSWSFEHHFYANATFLVL